MNTSKNNLVSWLFETKALRVSPQDKPFWYTAGTLGPYYMNTHFLYGSEESANALLKVIDTEKNNPLECSRIILEATKENYKRNDIYKGLIDSMISFITMNIGVSKVDYISGGERRDWFFSLLIAEMLDKKHITIFKDCSMVLYEKGTSEPVEKLEGKKVLHIADLITEASSYIRAWVPAIKSTAAEMKWSLVVIDRRQGGAENLASEGVKSYAMENIDITLFDQALTMGYVNKEQYQMIQQYIDNPVESMHKFLLLHPEFLKNALASDEKTKERAKMCMDKNIYNI